MQYLYDAGDEVVFMDEETYEQLSLPRAAVEDALPFMQPSSSVQVLFVGGEPSGVDLPAAVVLEVTDTEPGVKGDTVSNVTKPATLETGGVVQVPLFVERRRQDQGRPAREALHQPRLAGLDAVGARRRRCAPARGEAPIPPRGRGAEPVPERRPPGSRAGGLGRPERAGAAAFPR